MINDFLFDTVTFLDTYGVREVLLPFLLIFTVIYAASSKVKILGDQKQFRVIISLVVSLITIAPHVTGAYPRGYDVVDIINQFLPGVALIAIAVIGVLILLGLFGKGAGEYMVWLVGIIGIAFIVYTIGSAVGYWTSPDNAFFWWTPDLTRLLIVIAVFGLIVWFITRESTKPPKLKEGIENFLGKMFK